MYEEIEQAAANLRDRDIGWVTRRDAAEYLGKVAALATETLREHAEDGDTDIRDQVAKSLGWAQAGLKGVDAVAQERPYTLDELIQSVEKPGSRDVEKSDAGYAVTVSLRDDRKQTLLVEPATSKSDRDVIRVSTRCGPVKEKALEWALENNTGMSHCAMAISEETEGPLFVMTHSFLADSVTPMEFKACVKEVAFYGDWVESKLTKGDEF